MSDAKQFQSLIPILFVEEVEPCIEFWRERFGFAPTNEVREGDEIGFVMLVKDDVTIMYQSRESLQKDLPAVAKETSVNCNFLYFSVADIDDVEKRLEGLDLLVPRRDTFYGATEIGVREPGGNIVTFAQHKH